jgi:hypothetical protein
MDLADTGDSAASGIATLGPLEMDELLTPHRGDRLELATAASTDPSLPSEERLRERPLGGVMGLIVAIVHAQTFSEVAPGSTPVVLRGDVERSVANEAELD